MTNAWAKSVALYVAAMSEVTPPLTEEQLRRVEDALNALRAEHYALIAKAARMAGRQ